MANQPQNQPAELTERQTQAVYQLIRTGKSNDFITRKYPVLDNRRIGAMRAWVTMWDRDAATTTPAAAARPVANRARTQPRTRESFDSEMNITSGRHRITNKHFTVIVNASGEPTVRRNNA